MFQKIQNNNTAWIRLLCALLMVILLVTQFTPFWHYGEAGESCSISSYVWFPTDNKALETWLTEQDGRHDLNSFVGMPILVLALSAVGAVVCLIKPDSGMVSLLPAACGAAGVIGYLAVPALKLGTGWMWHLLICAVLLVLGIYGAVRWVKEM